MRITTSQLRRIIREELQVIREARSVNIGALEKLIMRYNNDPESEIPPKSLQSVGLTTNPEYTYRAVYGQIVARDDGDDVEFWSNELNRWKRIDYEDRQHSVSIHNPQQ
jgi:hypothetical protein